MKTIKFRAWDKANKKMLVPLSGILWGVAVVPANYAQGHFNGEIPDNYSYIFESEMLSVEQVELMQFTGLLDKNGREIYEGDILKIQDATAKVVFWEKPPEFGLNFYHNEDAWCEDWNLSDDSKRMEIIGNIYENPEMVKDKG